MKILISYDSKWSASMSDSESHKPKTVSLGTVQEKTDKEKAIELDETDNYESVMKKINSGFANFDYRSISKSTVLGVMARLLGEIRYLDKALEEPDHIINLLKDKIDFSLHERDIYNEILTIATPKKEVQNNGGAFISKSKSDFLLLNQNTVSEILYALFNLKTKGQIWDFINYLALNPSIEAVQTYIKNNNLVYTEKYEIYMFVKHYQTHVKEFSSHDNEYRKYLKKKKEMEEKSIEIDDESDGMNEELKDYISLIEKLGEINLNNEKAYFSSNYINIIGLLCYSVIWWLKRIDQSDLIDKVLIKSGGNIEGIATLSGGMTIKDFYSRVAPKKQSWSSPYFFDTKYLKKQNAKQFNAISTKLGMGKESGLLEISIEVDEEKAKELREQIKAVGVSTFQLGKKGLAYIQEINIYE